MRVEEFLAWDDGTGTRYELVDGVPVAMASPDSEHRTIVGNAARMIGNRLLSRPPCRAEVDGAVRTSDSTCWAADIVVTCGRRSYEVDEPLLIVEVLSPSTRARDLDRKLRDYKDLSGLREVWLVDSERRWVQVWQREAAGGWVGRDHIGSGSFASPVLEEGAPPDLDELYLNTGL